MEPEQTEKSEDQNAPTTPTPIPTSAPMNPFTTALYEMEARLAKNMKEMINSKEDTITKNMKEMIEPIKLDISSLV